MAVTITDMLGVSPFGQSRIIINTNINALASEVNNIESVFGLSLASGNFDVSGSTGGIVKAKQFIGNTAQFPASGPATLTLNGATGAVAAATVVASTSITAPTITATNFVVAVSGGATFNSPAAFLDIAEFYYGQSRGVAVDVGSIAAYTVNNYDNVVIFDALPAAAITLTPDVSLVDGHEITFIYKGTGAGVTIPLASLVGSLTANFTAVPYASAFTLVYQFSSGKWLVTGYTNGSLT